MTSQSRAAQRRAQGFTLVELILVVAVISTIATMAIPVLFNARASGNEASAVAALRTLVSVNEQYRTRYSTYASDLNAMTSAGYIDSVLASGVKAGYTFTYAGAAYSYTVSADPQVPGESGNRFFFADTSGVLRFSTAGTADASSAAVDG